MELRHLKYFVTVAEEENITRAARRLNVSQPPLSRQIRDLEAELGLQLFERRPQALALTAAGRVFLGEARAVLGRAEEALRVAASLAGGGRRELNIGYAPSLTVEILPGALRLFEAKGHTPRIRLHDLSTGEMVRGLETGDLDIALMIRPAAGLSGAISLHPLQEHPVCLAMHPAHPLAKTSAVSLRQICGERLIAYSEEDYPEYHSWLKKLFRKFKAPPAIAEAHDSSTSLIASVEAGRGVALVQQGFESLSGPRLVIRPVDPPPPPFVVCIAWRTEAAGGIVSAFIAAAKEGMR